jgi:hypothetical protein
VNVERQIQRKSPTVRSVEEQLIAAVERSQLQHRPFDYIQMDQVLDPETYRALLAAMPDRRFYHDLKHRHALRKDGTSTRLRMFLYPELVKRLPEEQRRVWLPVAQALSSRKLELAFKRKFRDALERRFGKPVERVGIYPVPILLRDKPGYRIGIHSDSKNKAITVQYYLPADESQNDIGTIFHEGRSGPAAEKTIRMPFLPATGYAFPVALTESWHSAARTQEHHGERVSMMVTYFVADDPWNWLRFRFRRIISFFGLHPGTLKNVKRLNEGDDGGMGGE